MNFKTYHKIEKRFVTIHDINFDNSTVAHDAQGEFRIDVSKFEDLTFLRLTGLRDKANQEIFEGDICEYEFLDEKGNQLDYAKGDIRFRKGSFRLDGIGYGGIESYLEDFWEDDNRTSLKIIGNVYEKMV